EKNTASQSTFLQGKAVYMTYCSSCHGRDRNGDEPLFPSLVGLSQKMTKEQALAKIRDGSGRMPAFKSLLNGKEEAIVAFLFDVTGKRGSQTDADIFEIQTNNRSQNKVVGEDADTTSVYLNLTPYGHFNDIDGHPAIKPPWGTLNAINLNTGEYAWQIPV